MCCHRACVVCACFLSFRQRFDIKSLILSLKYNGSAVGNYTIFNVFLTSQFFTNVQEARNLK